MSRPFGYEADRHTIRKDEALIIRRAAERVLAGESLRSIVHTMNDAGVTTASGGAWQPIQLRRTLLNPRVNGRRKARSGRLVKADWPAILDDVTYKRVRQALEDPTRKLGGPPLSRVYLLTGGLACCGNCGKPLIARPAAKGRRGLRVHVRAADRRLWEGAGESRPAGGLRRHARAGTDREPAQRRHGGTGVDEGDDDRERRADTPR